MFEVRESAVAWEGCDVEIDRAIIGEVGVTFFHQLIDHRDLLWDVIDGARLDMWWEESELFAIGVKFFRPSAGEVGERLSGFL